MNNELYVDYLIVGFSISGISAAIKLASYDCSVCIAEYWQDTASLTGSAVIFPTQLNKEKLTGKKFEEIALQILYQSNVIVSRGLLASLSLKNKKKGIFFNFFDEIAERNVFATSTVFAPNGTEIGLSDRLSSKLFLGKGISYDAWSDGQFYTNKPVIIIGCGNRAIEQTYWMAKWASSVYLLCENDTLNVLPHWMEIIAESTIIKIMIDIKLNSIAYDNNSNVKGIILSRNGENYEKMASAIFVAQNLICDWSILGGEQTAKSYINNNMLYVCGLAAGINYSHHFKLFEDGINIAKKIIEG